MCLQLRRRQQSIGNKLPSIITLLAVFVLWFLICELNIAPGYMLPSPIDVLRAMVLELPVIAAHALYTLQEAFYGLAIGITLAFISATLMDRYSLIEQALYPVMVITQTIPTIAVAPILVLWMGFGMAPKIALVVLTTYFPISIGLLDGYKAVDKDAIGLLRTMGASNFQIFYHLKFPLALPGFFSGLKISASYAVVGAVVSEWLGGFNGLGVYMTRVRKAYAFDRMFAVIIFIVIVSLLLILLVNILRKIIIPWQDTANDNNI